MLIPFEVNKARSVLRVNRMAPSVDVLGLLRKYAEVEIASIPVDADAVCLNLKRPGVRATVILNKDRPSKRIRFTMAHELGHIVIPWHRGSIVDDVSLSPSAMSSYFEVEIEANRFASELLMPEDWIISLIKEVGDLARLARRVSDEADVSVLAAIIRLRSSLPKGFIFVELDSDNVVRRSWRSPGTLANEPHPGSVVNPLAEYRLAINRWSLRESNSVYWWWELPSSLELPAVKSSDWRSILRSITEDYTDDSSGQKKAYASISATAGNANGTGGATMEEVYAAMSQRFSSKAKVDPLFSYLMMHPLAEQYMAIRASTFKSR